MSDQDGKKRGPGRPKGSRNKSKIISAQLKLDGASEIAADTVIALMENDHKKLKCDEDVPYSLRFQACKLVMDKAIANEKDKAPADLDEKTPSTTQSFVPKVHTQSKANASN